MMGKDVYQQSKFIFQKIESALKHCGASSEDVVRSRNIITNMDDFNQFAKAHKETFQGIDPAATCVEVSRFVSEGLLIEIEVDAVLGG